MRERQGAGETQSEEVVKPCAWRPVRAHRYEHQVPRSSSDQADVPHGFGQHVGRSAEAIEPLRKDGKYIGVECAWEHGERTAAYAYLLLTVSSRDLKRHQGRDGELPQGEAASGRGFIGGHRGPRVIPGLDHEVGHGRIEHEITRLDSRRHVESQDLRRRFAAHRREASDDCQTPSMRTRTARHAASLTRLCRAVLGQSPQPSRQLRRRRPRQPFG